MESAVWHTVRSPSMLALSINTKLQFLLLLCARPIREEKVNEMESPPLRASDLVAMVDTAQEHMT